MENRAVIPLRFMQNVVALLGKPTGVGERPIALLTFVYRFWIRVRKPLVASWDEATHKFWDTAVKGSSPLKATLLRTILDEISVQGDGIKKGHAAYVLWDMAKFYDTVRWSHLADSALRLGYPSKILAIGLMVHSAPRMVRVRGGVSNPRTATAGILAGDSQANAFAKSVLYYVIHAVHLNHPTAGPCTYVDDLAQACRGPDSSQVVQELALAGLMLYEDLTSIGCNISPKSMIVASTLKLTKRLVKVFRANNLSLGYDTNVRDVGISNTAGKVRSAGLISWRISKAKVRNIKVSQLARKSRNAAKLFRTGVYPQATYGHQVTGLSPTQVRSLRTEAARATGRMKPGRCTTTLIQFIHGDHWNPAIRIRQEVLTAYINFWQEHQDIQGPIDTLWEQYVHTPPTWRNVTGPIGIAFMTVASLGLTPLTPWR